MKISILDTGKRSVVENMKIDQSLLNELDINGIPILHLYQWEGDSATFGYFAKPEMLLDLKQVKKKGLQLAKRATGGGMTFHFSDYAFSFLMPKNHFYFSENTLKNYEFVNQFVVKAVADLIESNSELELYQACSKPCQRAEQKDLNFCMAAPTKYDVVYKGQKIGGAAQRKTTKGYLHHGTISIALPDPEYLKDILKSKDLVFDAINQNTFYFVSNHLKQNELLTYREKIQKKLIESILQF